MANIQIQVDDAVKAAADSFFSNHGLNTETAVKVFISTVLETKGFPFALENFEKRSEGNLETIRQSRLDFMGCMEGKIWMADDFDAPLDDFKEYME